LIVPPHRPAAAHMRVDEVDGERALPVLEHRRRDQAFDDRSAARPGPDDGDGADGVGNVDHPLSMRSAPPAPGPVWDDVAMSTPPPMPSPTPRSPSAMPEGPFGGRRAARLRAVVNADLLPRERASADALVLTAWLSAAQRARYAPTLRAGGGVEEFVQRLADERRVVLEEGADEVAGELESAAAAERSARQLPLRLLEGALLLLEAGCGLWIVLLTLDAKDAG